MLPHDQDQVTEACQSVMEKRSVHIRWAESKQTHSREMQTEQGTLIKAKKKKKNYDSEITSMRPTHEP